MSKYVIVFAPHPDDETLGCGGTIIKKIREGYDVIIVFVTDGKYAFLKVLGINSNPSPNELKQIRKMEALRAAEILGVAKNNLFFLDFEDGITENYKEQIEIKIMEILDRYLPKEIYSPSDKDYNLDHRVVSRILDKCMMKSGFDIEIYKYSITQKFSRIGPFKDKILSSFKHNLFYSDISLFLSQKKAAVEQYKSQISIISGMQKRPIISDIGRFLRKSEIFYI